MKRTKMLLTSLLTSAIVLMSVPAVHADQSHSISEFEKYRLDAINQELSLKGFQTVNKVPSNSINTASPDGITNDNIEKLKKAEIVIMDFDDNGDLIGADSSVSGDDAIHRFGKVKKEKSTGKIKEVSALSTVPNTTPAPPGANSGAFHRLTSPPSTSSLSYTGAVADDITLPNYLAASGVSYGEAAYMYSGIDQSGTGIAEVGFATYSGSQGTGWFAVFHARATHDITTGSGADDDEYYYDFAHTYTGGQKITGYKVYYHTTDSVLTVTYQIGFNTIYVVKFTGRNSLNIAVKRVTAIAMPLDPNHLQTKFHVPYTSYANWGNYRWLTNNGAGTVYPTAVSNVDIDSWDHGGTIDYIKTIIVTNGDRDEQYLIS